ncbi:UvrB/uvrC motif [Paraliobacillus sp. PM-2]|uniref:UvrB/UvrC motif-containing protein n=1 Tax=Paraliobacillus sp. PM-2 TaxID=1462524 RepID=UPI00061BC788|nr:UvrB/UvrC motif-containing protein [Paraliobacillus sp. PM-2]CQR48552.1 UvrB/uvrC motif [Paraliobacillus sp. PM-2]
MECEECHERPATLHLTKVVNGEKNEIHVCEHCAKEKGYIDYDEEAYSIHDLLAGLFNYEATFSKGHQFSDKQKRGLSCPKCGMTYRQFTQIGKFGCASCYEAFANHLNPIFRRVHSGNITHDGKIPNRQGKYLKKKQLIQDYKSKLQRLIENEQFEEAAVMRDKIKALEKNSSENNKDGEL